jgi:hypothetical protein
VARAGAVSPARAACALAARRARAPRSRSRARLQLLAASTPPPSPPPGPEEQRDAEAASFFANLSLQRFLLQLVSYGGAKGTAAVVLAKVLGLDAFGGFDAAAAAADGGFGVGLALAAPLLVVDAVLMLPDWSAAPVDAPGAAAAGPDPWADFTEAANLYQRMKVATNAAIGMPAWQEGLVIVLAHLADEMLCRAVALTALSNWVLDRLFELDAFDVATAEARAPQIALALLMAAEVVRKQRALLRSVPVGAGVVAKDKVTGKTKLTQIAPDQMNDVASVPSIARNSSPQGIDSIQRQVGAARVRARTVAQLDALRGLADWAVYGGAFVLTGNLAVPVVTSTLVDALFSSHQRKGLVRLQRRRLAVPARGDGTAQLRSRLNGARAALAAKPGDAPRAGEAAELLARATAALLQAERAVDPPGSAATVSPAPDAPQPGRLMAEARELLASAMEAGGISEDELAEAVVLAEAEAQAAALAAVEAAIQDSESESKR